MERIISYSELYCITTMNLSKRFQKTHENNSKPIFLKIKRKPFPQKFHKFLENLLWVLGKFSANCRWFLFESVPDNSRPTLHPRLSFKTCQDFKMVFLNLRSNTPFLRSYMASDGPRINQSNWEYVSGYIIVPFKAMNLKGDWLIRLPGDFHVRNVLTTCVIFFHLCERFIL